NDLVLDADTLLSGEGSGSVTLRGTVTGTGGLIKEGAGTLGLSSSNSYSGETRLRQGTVRITGEAAPAAGPFGTGALQLGSPGSDESLVLEYVGPELPAGGGFGFVEPGFQPAAAPGLAAIPIPNIPIPNSVTFAGSTVLAGGFTFSVAGASIFTNVALTVPGAGG